MKKTTLLAALGLLVALAFGPPPVKAAVTEAWVHRYSNVVSNSDDQAVKVVRDAAGDIIVTGTTDDRIHGSDMLTIKYSGTDGSVLWQQRYNGPANSDDRAMAVAVDGSGNVVVTGSSTGTNGYYEYCTTKYAAADGARLWEKRYSGPGGYDQARAVDVDGSGNVVVTGYSATIKYLVDGTGGWTNAGAAALAVDGNGNVVVTGTSYSSNGYSDYYTAKYAATDGALLWEKRYNGPANNTDEPKAIALDGNGNVVVTGYSWGGANGYDYYTAKYAAADGALLWEQRYNGPANSDDYAQAVALDGSGNVVVTGYSGTWTNSDYYTAKYAAANGALLWEQRYNGPWISIDQAQAIAIDGSGNVVVTGSSAGTNAWDYYTAKYAAADGTLLWEQRYDGPANSYDYAQAVAVDGSGNVLVTGSSNNGGPNYYNDYYTAKYAAADGALLWEQRYNGPSNGDDRAQAVAVDGSGNVVVTGSSSDNKGYTDYYTAKYAVADGALLWEQRYNAPGQADHGDQANAVALDSSGNVVVTGFFATIKYLADGTGVWTNAGAAALAVDGSGNVVVTGSSYDTNFNYDYSYTAKYAADGALLWEKRYNGPADGYNLARAVALDGSGNVVVTGYSNGTNNDYYYTAKYAAADGALLWERRYGYSYGSANALALDGSGNVVVTGSSAGTNAWDYYTAKYAAADGALLWEKRYNGPLNNGDHARAVAVDGSGNVVVTGVSDVFFSTGCDFPRGDYYTAKYAAANGALLWEQRYNGPADDRDVARSVVADVSGNVVVTGISNNGAPNYDSDFYTAKYAAADGALLWEKRYNAAARNTYMDERVGGSHSLALGPNGMVAVTGSSSGDYATVVYRDDVYPISIALVPTGIRLRFTGIPGRSYTIERAPTVTGPWTTLNTQIAPASGLLEYQDAAPHSGSSFYRTAQL